MATSTTLADNTVSSEYLYSWSPVNADTLSIEEFIAKYRPSMVQNDGTKPWIWVRREAKAGSSSVENEANAVVEATALLQQTTERVGQIKNDASIPIRGSKKSGIQSKKEVREQVQAEAADKLKVISNQYGFTCGKWMVFVPPDKVDIIWSKIASSIVSGPLSSTSVFCAKVATSPGDADPGYQHLICVYMPNVYDKEDVTVVMKVLLRQHGLNLSDVKSDLYSMIGLDSKHPSGIPSTIWRNASLMKDAEIKELKEAFYAELSAAKISTAKAESSKSSKPSEGKSKFLVKKRAAEDPFSSNDETDSAKNGKSTGMDAKRKNAESENEGNKSPVKRKKAL